MKNSEDDLGIWTDCLDQCEVEFSKTVAGMLREDERWHKFLNTKQIKRAIEIVNPIKKVSEIRQIKSALFEVRVAYFLHELKLACEYEHPASVGESTVDFKINSNPSWLIELTSIHEGAAIKRATIKSVDENSGDTMYSCSPTLTRGNSQEIIDILRVQDGLTSKVANKDGKPTKFPDPIQNQYHMLIIDMRSFNMGHTNIEDFVNIVYGCVYLFCEIKDKKEPVKGIFDKLHPDLNCKLIRERIHAIGFIEERSYQDMEILENLKIFHNPNLFDSREELLAILPVELKNNVFDDKNEV